MDIWNIALSHLLSIKLSRVLLDIFWYVKQSLQIPQRVISFTLVDLTIEFAFACTIDASLIDRDLLCACIAGGFTAFIET